MKFCLDDFCWKVWPCKDYLSDNPVLSLVEPQLKHTIHDKSFEGKTLAV